jgi:hypothetical protein
MKVPMIVLAVLSLAGCSGDMPPFAPDPPAPAPNTTQGNAGWLWLMVVDGTGRCIAGATIEVVAGQGPVGEAIAQDTPCGAWDYDGGVWLPGLTPGVALTLRASAAGYSPVEESVMPIVGAGRSHLLLLVRSPD